MNVVSTAPPVARPRPSRPSRRIGYVLAALINGGLLWLVDVAPGWEVVPFLTPAFGEVLSLVTTSIAVGLVANLAYCIWDPPRLRAAGDVVVTGIGLVVLIALWRTFPFALGGQSFDWELVARVLLGLGVVGSVIGIVVAVVTLVTGRPDRP